MSSLADGEHLPGPCAACGHPRHEGEAWTGFGGREVFHSACASLRQWRTAAEERLAVLQLILEVGPVTASDLRGLAEWRPDPLHPDRTMANAVFRVLRSIEQAAEADETETR